MKTCARCKKSLDEVNFCKDKQRKDGLNKYCRSCASGIHFEHRDRDNENSRKYYQEHKKEHAILAKEWYLENLEKRKQYRKQYYIDHREEAIAYSNKWVRDHPIKAANACQIHKVRKAGGIVENVDRAAIIERDKSTCQICGKILAPNEITLDHIIPIHQKGPHNTENLRVACITCNNRRPRPGMRKKK